MTRLAALYQHVVIDHNRSPRNYRPVNPHSHHAVGYNPLCGDRVELFLDVYEGIIRDIGFQGESCAIATASASLLTATLMGRRVDEARSIARRFNAELEGTEPPAGVEGLGELEALLAVRNFPGREKCARLAWRALEAALGGEAALAVTTEAERSGSG
ncbi:MAG: SUF system NifU family Fe-S cluster assembly protein [Aquisalimonadaceae bacterium]